MKIKKKPETKVRFYPQGKIGWFMPEGVLKEKTNLLWYIGGCCQGH